MIFHFISLLVAIAFSNVIVGYSFGIFVACLNFFGGNVSAAGLLAISLQISLTISAVVINLFFVNKQKYRLAIQSIDGSKRLTLLASALIFGFWFYLAMTEYMSFSTLSLAAGVEKIKEITSIFLIIVKWAVSVVFSLVIYFLYVNASEFLKGYRNEL